MYAVVNRADEECAARHMYVTAVAGKCKSGAKPCDTTFCGPGPTARAAQKLQIKLALAVAPSMNSESTGTLKLDV